MLARSALDVDVLPAIARLQRDWDSHWFGAPENDESEVVVTPTADAAPLYDDLLPCLRASGAETVEALDRNLATRWRCTA